MPIPKPISNYFLGVALCATAAPLSAEVLLPALDSSQLEPALKGRVLIEELNCVACHEAATLRSGSRQAPRLSAVGSRVNPAYLQAFIENPHQVKPGTPMPDALDHLEAVFSKYSVAEKAFWKELGVKPTTP